MMNKRLWAAALSICIACTQLPPALAATLGPAETISDLRAMLDEAVSGDTLLISGDVAMDRGEPLTCAASVLFASQSGETATLRGLRLRDISVSFSDIRLEDSLVVSGTSTVHLARSARVRGRDGQSALSFTGSGTLIIDPGCVIEGISGGDGVSIQHTGGEFYGSIEGRVLGGSGDNGGTAVLISPLGNAGAVLVAGDIQGGEGISLGGHALDLYNLSGNAFVTVAGSLTGGSGFIGGDGVQLVSASDTVSVGINASVKGGAGQSYGGSALILMNASDSSSFNLSGAFSGGNAIGEGSTPGTSLQLVGDGAVVRTRIDNCILEEGRHLNATPKPEIILTPEPTATPTAKPTVTPAYRSEVTPLPEITSPADNVAYIITPEPPRETPEPTPEAAPEPTAEPSEAPPSEPAAEPDAPAGEDTE